MAAVAEFYCYAAGNKWVPPISAADRSNLRGDIWPCPLTDKCVVAAVNVCCFYPRGGGVK